MDEQKVKVYICDKCGQAIYYGEHYVVVGGKYQCKNCLKQSKGVSYVENKQARD